MIGKINIFGEIGVSVSLMDVVLQVETQPGAIAFDVTIDSLGGFCDVGHSIYAYLKSLPKPITTIAVNQCASIATVIFLAGSKRKALCNLMIHNPWMGGVEGDADVFELAAADIRAEEDKIINLYHKETGVSKTALDALMKKETYITPEEALKLRFATEGPGTESLTLTNNYKAVARTKENKDMSKENKDLIDQATKLFGEIKTFMVGHKPKPKDLVVSDESGKSLSITKPDGTDISGAPMQGDMVTVDGVAGEGDYSLPELNLKITVAGGIITVVTDTSQASVDPKLTEALKKIEDLVKENSNQKALIEASKKDSEAVAGKLTEFEGLLKSMSGKTELPEAKNQFRSPEKDATLDDIKKAKAEREKSYKK